MICDECRERADTDGGCRLSEGLDCPSKCDCQHRRPVRVDDAKSGESFEG